jgi:hypothetical protein
MPLFFPALAGAALSAAQAVPATNHLPCFTTYRGDAGDWAKNAPIRPPPRELPSDRWVVVSHHVSSAIALLQQRPFEPLSIRQARRFNGDERHAEGLRPFLVRALLVPEQGNGVSHIGWDGHTLEVIGEGMGCPRLAKHPIIVFLERAPTEVFIEAGGPN